MSRLRRCEQARYMLSYEQAKLWLRRCEQARYMLSYEQAKLWLRSYDSKVMPLGKVSHLLSFGQATLWKG